MSTLAVTENYLRLISVRLALGRLLDAGDACLETSGDAFLYDLAAALRAAMSE